MPFTDTWTHRPYGPKAGHAPTIKPGRSGASSPQALRYCFALLLKITSLRMIFDVDATTSIRQAEVEITKDMILRTRDRFGLYPEKLAADTVYGSAPMLCWLVEEEGIEPYIPAIHCPAGERSAAERGRVRSQRRHPFARRPCL